MQRCLKCGKVYQVKHIIGYCSDCIQVVNKEPKPTSLSSSSQVSLESYEEEVERIQAAQNAPKPKKVSSSYSKWYFLIAFTVVLVLLLASLAITVIAFGLTKHGVLWSLSIVFFFLGASAILTKRLMGKRAANLKAGEQIEPAVANVVGGLCLLPLGLCTFFYGMNTDMPPNHSLWIVGIMLVAAFFAVVVGSVALSKAS